MSLRKKASVIGSPVFHSLSPAIFKIIAEHEGIDFEYLAEEVEQDRLPEFLNSLRISSDRVGCNVTLPLKEAVIPYLDSVSDEAEMVGAVNVIHKVKNTLYGFNTDVAGIEKTFEIEKFDPKKKNCFLYGAGGAAKAAAYLMAKKGASQIVIFNPRSNRGEQLCALMKEKFPMTDFVSISNMNEAPPCKYSLVVNATPLGMKSDTDYFSELKNLTFETSALALDLIYTPAVTSFMKEGKALGLQVAGGLSMLIEQAISTWELWVGAVSYREELHKFLAAQLRGYLYFRAHPEPIFLTGFMGVGKSTVARELAEILRWECIDTDFLIQSKMNKNISEIFKERGESEFRKLEQQAIGEAVQKKNTVVSLGGGALMNFDNLERVKKAGTLIYLEDTEKNLFKRLSKQQSSRPLLADLTNAEKYSKIANMLAERRPVYEKAHVKVSVQGHSSYSLARDIIEKMGQIK